MVLSDANNTKISEENNNSVRQTNSVILKTFITTLVLIVFALGYLISISVVVFPKTIISAFDFMGMDRANYVVYQRLYERKKTNDTLYNALQLSVKYNDYVRTEQYSKAMLDSFEFSEFASKVNTASKNALGLKYSALADDYESYVRRNLTIALYKNQKFHESKVMALDSVYGNADELSVYINCVLNDNSLTSFEKNSEIGSFYSRYDVFNQLEVLLSSDEFNPNIESDLYKKVIAVRQRIKIYEIKYYILSATNKIEEAEEIQQLIIDNQGDLNYLITNLA